MPCPAAPPTFVWNPCDALPARAAPVYNAYFEQENYLQGVEMPAVPTVILVPGLVSFHFRFGPSLVDVPLTKVIARFGVCASYTQSWFVTDVRIGDLEAVRGLAPAEEVELELRTSVTSRVERTAAAAEDVAQSSETLRSNKEIQEAMQTAAIDGGWSSSSSSSYRLGLRFLWLNFGGGDSSSEASQQFSRASSQTLQSLRETVSRATEAVRAQTKVEVRGVRETVVSERNVRRFRNPYFDRSLLIKVFSVFKSYRISTSRSAVRLGLTFEVESFETSDFSVRAFALANRGVPQNRRCSTLSSARSSTMLC